jgi:hypothetical protein
MNINILNIAKKYIQNHKYVDNVKIHTNRNIYIVSGMYICRKINVFL